MQKEENYEEKMNKEKMIILKSKIYAGKSLDFDMSEEELELLKLKESL